MEPGWYHVRGQTTVQGKKWKGYYAEAFILSNDTKENLYPLTKRNKIPHPFLIQYTALAYLVYQEQ